jgi:uncharacterized membrane protein YebE (DUF533 family)
MNSTMLLWLAGGAAALGVGYMVYQQNQQSQAAGTQPLPADSGTTSTGPVTSLQQLGDYLSSSVTAGPSATTGT